ncbi:MAG: metallophosphoesterase [Sneathiella sp.]
MFGFTKRKIRVELDQGVRVIAIGDIHGQIDRLRAVMEDVDHYRQKNPVQEEHIVFLGDFTDRGPASADVIEYLLSRKKNAKLSDHTEIFLKGNHEQLLLDALSGKTEKSDLWWRNGGRETVHHYADYCGFDLSGDIIAHHLEKLRENFPDSHLKFFDRLETQYRVGPLVFVHAGIRMDKPLKDQQEEDLIWIRGTFLNWKGPPKKYLIVHGHTITSNFRPEIKKHRIGLDTGSYRLKGQITAGLFEGNKVRFISNGTKKNFKSSPFD